MSPEEHEAFGSITAGELVAMLREAGDMEAHPAMPLAGLRQRAAYPIESPSRGGGPYDQKRREVMGFLQRHLGRIQVKCHSNCFLHGDARVAQCWLKIKGTLS